MNVLSAFVGVNIVGLVYCYHDNTHSKTQGEDYTISFTCTVSYLAYHIAGLFYQRKFVRNLCFCGDSHEIYPCKIDLKLFPDTTISEIHKNSFHMPKSDE